MSSDFLQSLRECFVLSRLRLSRSRATERFNLPLKGQERSYLCTHKAQLWSWGSFVLPGERSKSLCCCHLQAKPQH